MRIIYQQSSQLREQFNNQVESKKDIKKEKLVQEWKGSFIETILPLAFDINQSIKSFKGSFGESFIFQSLSFLSDEWVCIPNALIPVADSVTEVDCLLVSTSGVFLIEVKTWTGSFAAYRDKWKRREHDRWILLENSPTKQSLYHQRCFYRWVRSLVSGLPSDFVQAPVVFLSAKWIGEKESSVPVLHGSTALKNFLVQVENCLSLQQVSRLVEVISQARSK